MSAVKLEPCGCFNTCSSCEEQLFRNSYLRRRSCFNTCSSCEEQLFRNSYLRRRSCFNTCSSCEEQQKVHLQAPDVIAFQYMLLLRGATSIRVSCRLSLGGFNTCSSCEEQLDREIYSTNEQGFNTCSSCEEQQVETPELDTDIVFQYMLLLRGATTTQSVISRMESGFNTCSSCEEQHRQDL